MAQPAPPPALEPHGERRRSQLIRAAAFVIEHEGVASMRPPRVAEVISSSLTLFRETTRIRSVALANSCC